MEAVSEKELYRRLRLATMDNKNDKGAQFPVELLMEWDKVRMKLNPKAKKTNLLQYENISLGGTEFK